MTPSESPSQLVVLDYREADATDANAFLEPLDSSLFPGLSSSIEAHSGFANEQAKTATTILSNVQKAISAHGAKQVTLVGHSLGKTVHRPPARKRKSNNASQALLSLFWTLSISLSTSRVFPSSLLVTACLGYVIEEVVRHKSS